MAVAQQTEEVSEGTTTNQKHLSVQSCDKDAINKQKNHSEEAHQLGMQ